MDAPFTPDEVRRSPDPLVQQFLKADFKFNHAAKTP